MSSSDDVQRLIELAVPELIDLSDRGLFSRAEVSGIVRRRTAFEYKLHRRDPLLSDYLSAIAYELNLNELRILRRRRMPSARGDADRQTSVGDFGQLDRARTLFQRAIKRFPSERALWRDYLTLLTLSKAHRLLARAYPQLLRAHPHYVDGWIAAAEYQSDELGNESGRRTVMQRAIRINAHATKLWTAFFAQEIKYVCKSAERWRLLTSSPHDSAAAETDSLSAVAMSKCVLPRTILDNAMAANKDTSVDWLIECLRRVPSASNSAYVPNDDDAALFVSFLEHNEKSSSAPYDPLVQMDALCDVIITAILTRQPTSAFAIGLRSRR